ncbi:MAG: sugar phosphate isomerase/epimerase [Bryobacteraceae bacterium]|nr:sugar phosphate isomerase/epimerase [Bryobacteraceae bacterium]MCX7605493.1 sugar phosphate isomerase/epimerase [Bryobacteraceae bacterium]
MTPKLELAAITDEFSPDLHPAATAMAAIGMTAAELRVVWGKNIMNLSDDEVKRAVDVLSAKGIRVLGISSPILKCTLPEGGEVDSRFQQDIFGAAFTMQDQPRLVERAIQLCELTGARLVRVFSFWRTVDPERCFEPACRAIEKIADQFKAHGIVCGIENEHACNIGTASEAAKFLAAMPHTHVRLVWDPANALVAGEQPYPYGYSLLPKDRIAHVHAKDCAMEGHKPVWGPLGTRHVDWKGQIAALLADGYRGAVSLETHWPGPAGNKFEASIICGWNLRGLLAA